MKSSILSSIALGLGLFSAAGAVPCSGSGSVKTVGTRFSIDGKTGYFPGTNAYWISFLQNAADVELTMGHIASSGLKVLRVWGFNDVTTKPGAGQPWFQYLSSSGSEINTGADGLGRLDTVVKSAEKNGIKLIIPFVNYWDDYGGMGAYVSAFGGSKETWYTNSKAQAQYKAFIKAVVGRYSKSSAIFAWELANEPRCRGCSTDVVYNWATDISAYIRSLDASHLITLGDEGFGIPGDTTYPYGYSEGIDFVKNLGIKNLDFGTIHMYPSSWSVPASFGSAWIQNHAKACKAAGKPCLLEEYGNNADCASQKVWQEASLALRADGQGGDLFWQWGDQLSIGQTHNDGNTVFYGSSLATCLVTDHVNAIKAAQ
ncbi:glycoside hydrolase superfamily [Staphylotrichum tortipilum]|uniref:Mannan endo-1,4-beta-mannosidase A n=1 Tax=Staphylotrichum tortipilum TaxID=2831512 RepID=A0AAN6MLS8_9PEZI|nr:glycoside hydrolase superfamily [Staphylotrichum longicolle]